MARKKEVRNLTGSRAEDEKAILEFLRTKGVPYSEPRLIHELFGVKEEDEEIPISPDELASLRRIKEILRQLVKEKKIFAANLEDADTKEQVIHYSAKGWFATP
ncbi:MAG: hypothetical protein ABI361_07470 [Nitrososphaera sp.]|jgi:DNA-binding ferritin-like protein